MSRDSVKVEGLPELKRALNRKVEELRAAAATVVAAEVKAIHDDASSHAPVDTGELRSDIEDSAEGATGTVHATSRHAAFMEFGTSKDAAQPFMKPAAERARKRFPARAAAIIRAALGG